MDIIAIGLYNKENKQELKSILKNFEMFNLEFDYKPFNIESEKGLEIVKEYFSLNFIGIIHFKNDVSPFYSGPILREITTYYISKEYNKQTLSEPYFFKLIDAIEKSKIDKFILIFADEFDENDGIRLETLNIKNLKSRLINVYVWEEEYLILKSNTTIPENYHPLILDIKNN